MPNRPSRIEIQAKARAADNLFHGRYPLGNAPIGLAGNALSSSAGSGLLSSTGGGTLQADLFPRLATYPIDQISGSQYALTAWPPWAGKHNIVIYNWYIGIEQSIGATFASIMQAQQARGVANGITSRSLMYMMQQNIATALNNGGNTDTAAGLIAAANGNNWWVRSSWPSGTITQGDASTDGQINDAVGGPGDTHFGTGLSCAQFWPYYGYNVFTQGKAVSLFSEANNIFPNPFLNGIFMDNQFWSPRTSGSWEWNTTNFNAATQWATLYPLLQQGHANMIAAWRAIAGGGFICGGNVDCAADFYGGTPSNQPVHISTPWNGVYDVGLAETVMGLSFSVETSHTFAQVMAALIAQEAMLATGGAGIFGQGGRNGGVAWTSAPQTNWTAADWQALRYGETWAWLRNWYYAANIAPNYLVTDMLWSDDFDAGGTGLGWLANATDAAQSVAQFNNGVFGRHFQGGLILTNPSGNGTQSVPLPAGSYKTLPYNGFSDPTVNTNTQVNSVSLPAASGIALRLIP